MQYQFSNLIGNSNTLTLLQRSIANNSFKNFTILEGVPGIGKTSSAIISALALTCKNQNNGEPCLQCSSCKAILSALTGNGMTSNFVKVNMPEKNNTKDFSELIKEIFCLQYGTDRVVYVLEEAHALSNENLQQALLTHLDTMPENVYVIMTTTESYKLIEPLQRRARIYTYKRLNREESERLTKLELSKHGITRMENAKEIINLIIKNAHGIPSKIADLVEFIVKDELTLDEFYQYVNEIDNSIFIELFSAVALDSSADMLITLDDIIDQHNNRTIINRLKEFYINCIYLVEGGIKENFTTEQCKAIKSIFHDADVMPKIAKVVSKLTPNTSSSDLKFAFIAIHQLFRSKKPSSIITDNSQNAMTQTKAAAKNKKIYETETNTGQNKVDKLTPEFMMQSMNVFGE